MLNISHKKIRRTGQQDYLPCPAVLISPTLPQSTLTHSRPTLTFIHTESFIKEKGSGWIIGLVELCFAEVYGLGIYPRCGVPVQHIAGQILKNESHQTEHYRE